MNPDKIAERWYRADEVAGVLSRSGSGAFGVWVRPPDDVNSQEFAEWLTVQLQRAMAKGIQIGREEP